MSNLALVLVALGALSACHRTNGNYCAGANVDDNCGEGDAGKQIDAAVNSDGQIVGCVDNTKCTVAGENVCNVATSTCVQCTPGSAGDHDACTGMTPTCGSDDSCHACTKNADCVSNACLPSGACGTDTDTAFVAPSGSGSDCTSELPCLTLEDAIATARANIKVAAGAVDAGSASIGSGNITIIADTGAKLGRTASGSVLAISGSGTSVAIYELEFTGGHGGSSDAMVDIGANSPHVELHHVTMDNNPSLGVKSTSGMVVIARSSFISNAGGGVNLQSDFDVSNSLFVLNGGPGTTTGGAVLFPVASYAFDFNTLADNSSSGGTFAQRGVACLSAMSIANNIVVDNGEGTACTATYSILDSNVAGSPTNKTGLVDTDLFTTITPGAAGFYRLKSGAAAIDAGDPAATDAIDIDGDSRPAGSGYDIGADEYKP